MRSGFRWRFSMAWLVIWLVMVSVLAGGCAQRRFAQDGRAAGTRIPVVYRTEVALGSCLFGPAGGNADLHALVVEALAASAISAGIDAIGAALAEAAQETQDKAAAFRNVVVDKESFGPCLQIVRGRFYEFATADERATAEADGAAWSGPIDAAKRRELWTRRMRLAAAPDFVFEAELVATHFEAGKDDAYLTLVPLFAWLGEPLSHRTLRFSKARDVSVFFGFSDAGERSVAAEGVGAGIVVGRLERGVARRYAPFEGDTTATPNRGPAESQWFRLKLGAQKRPMRVAALVVEHQDESAFFGFVAGAFGAAKPGMKAVAAAQLPSARAAARESALSAGEEARDAFEAALAAMHTAAVTCGASGGDVLALATRARASIRTFNAAARAEHQDPIAEDVVPLSGDRAAVRSGCEALRAAIDRRFSRAIPTARR